MTRIQLLAKMLTHNHLKSGFSLLEVMFALTIMIIGLSSLFVLLPKTLEGATSSRTQEQALEIHETINQDIMFYLRTASSQREKDGIDEAIVSNLDNDLNLTFIYNIQMPSDNFNANEPVTVNTYFDIKGNQLEGKSKKSYYKSSASITEEILDNNLGKKVRIISIETVWPYIAATGSSTYQLKSIKTLSL